eukprot:15464601-Alexandrium_andersonii.AAC.1
MRQPPASRAKRPARTIMVAVFGATTSTSSPWLAACAMATLTRAGGLPGSSPGSAHAPRAASGR